MSTRATDKEAIKSSEARTPIRIQRKRTRGWRMPEGAIYVGRPTRYGNPFTEEEYGNLAVLIFEQNLKIVLAVSPDFLKPLRGKDLACWCPSGSACHADVLLKYANR